MAIQLSELRAVPPLRQYNYEMVIPSWPGGGNGDLLRIVTLTANIPGLSTEPIETSVGGFVEKFAGRGMYPRSLPIEYRETRDLTVWNALYNWRQICWNDQTGAQGSDSGGGSYKTLGFLRIFREDKSLIRSIRFEGLWPEDVGDIPMDASASDAVRVSVTFSYDYVVPE